jgi:hypothetical protein
VVNGYPDGTFRPTQPITRQAVAAVITRFTPDFGLVLLEFCGTPPFSDVPVDHPFCPNINALADTGVSNGYPDGTFRPTEPVTRQAFVAMLVRWLDVLGVGAW